MISRELALVLGLDRLRAGAGAGAGDNADGDVPCLMHKRLGITIHHD
jgi:hypothetical protein